MSEAFIGEIRMFAGTFNPQNWQFCNGQTLPISQYSALFAILGTTYGGNGTTTFNLPDLRSRMPVHAGQGQGLSQYVLGQVSGVENVTLNVNQMPSHTHAVKGDTSSSGQNSPAGNVPGTVAPSAQVKPYSNVTTSLQPMNAAAIGNTGGNQAVQTLPPSLCVNFIICINGIFPSRN